MAQIPSLPPTGIFIDMLTGFRRICETINLLLKVAGNFFTSYSATFQSGAIAFGGPNGSLQGAGKFQLGFQLPNASGIPSPGILLGGATDTQVVYITDEQIPGIKGINVIREAGDASSTGAANWDGGDLLDFAGGTLHGNGGTAKYQGGTSVSLRGGDAILHGGNSTTGIPGNAVVIGGETGSQGANVLLIATKVSGIAGDVRHQINSTILQQFLENGEIYLTLSGTGAGLAGQPLVSGGIGAAAKWQTGFTGTITTAKLTGGGANGSMAFASGILISETPAT